MELWDHDELCEIVKNLKPDFKFPYREYLHFDPDDIDTYVPAYICGNYILINVSIEEISVDVYQVRDGKLHRIYTLDDSCLPSNYFMSKMSEAYVDFLLTKEIEKEMGICEH